MVTEDQVQSIQVFQDPSRASMTQPRPWTNTVELPAIGDFIRVHKGDSHGKEGCIKDLNSDVNNSYIITVMTAHSNVPTVVFKSDGDIGPPTVSNILLPVLYITVLKEALSSTR